MGAAGVDGGAGVERHAFRATDWLCSPALADASLGSALLPSRDGEGVAATAGGSVVTDAGVGTESEL